MCPIIVNTYFWNREDPCGIVFTQHTTPKILKLSMPGGCMNIKDHVLQPVNTERGIKL